MSEIALQIIISVGASTALALIAVIQKALTRSAVLVAWLCSIVITFCGGITGFAILASTFAFTVIAGKIKRERRAIEKEVHNKTGRRDTWQVFCNVGTGSIALLIGKLTGEPLFELIYAAIMASSLADSLASELGILSRGEPFDICTFRRIQRGISGGVSVLGLASSLLGAMIIAVVYSIGRGWDIGNVVFISLCGFAGALADSILGSVLQIKYRCAVCGIATEKLRHCERQTLPIKGFKCITNDTVNIMSNILVGILSAGILFLHI